MEEGTTWLSNYNVFMFGCPSARIMLAIMIFTARWLNCMTKVIMHAHLFAVFPDYAIYTQHHPGDDSENVRSFGGAFSIIGVGLSGSVEQTFKRLEDNLTKLEGSSNLAWTDSEIFEAIESYYKSYAVSAFVGGFVAEYFGPKIVVLVAMAFSAVLVIISPAAMKHSQTATVVVRLITGAAGSVLFPALQALIARWAPPAEKGKFLSLNTGEMIGFIITWGLSLPLVKAFGWEGAFYVHGASALVWCVIWFFLVYDTPLKHPRISEGEKNYIVSSIGDKVNFQANKTIPPFMEIFTSVPCLAMLLLYLGTHWCWYIMTMYIHKFLAICIKNIDFVKTGGVLLVLPFFATFISAVTFGSIADWITAKKLMDPSDARKFFCLFSHVTPGLLFGALAYSGASSTVLSVFLAIIWCCIEAECVTSLYNCQDLAPNFAGTLFGIAYGVGRATDFFEGKVIAQTTKGLESCSGWYTLFTINACVSIATAIFFFVVGTAETQRWNYPAGVTPSKEKSKQ